MAISSYPANDPLIKVDGESIKANTALNDYALMGKGRSLRKLQKIYVEHPEPPPTKNLQTLERWSSENQWQVRIADHERLRYLEQIARREERLLEWEDKAWQVANQLMERAEQMLKFPLVETETKNGKTIVTPARWSVDTIARFVQTADKVARLATHAETEHHQVEVDWLKSLPPHVSPEQVDSYVDELAAQVLLGLSQAEA